MADLLIKGVEKLKAGQMLQVAENCNGVLYVRETTKGEWCPLVEVSKSHRIGLRGEWEEIWVTKE